MRLREFSARIKSTTDLKKKIKVNSIKAKYKEIISLYQQGLSGKEISNKLGFKHSNSVRQVLKRYGVIRSQSEASLLAVKNGKKENAIQKLIKASKTTNRFNPNKHPWSGSPELHPNWVKDRSKLKNKRGITEEKIFFKELIKGSNYLCQLTGQNGALSVHHIKGVWKYPELVFDKTNCIVITKKIHNKFHNIYGNRTDENDWLEFVNNKEYESEIVFKKRNFIPFEDKVGKRYGRLVVLCRDNKKWKCICDCGVEVSVFSSGLNRGSTKSCGCLMRQVNRDRLLRKKIWELSPASKKGYVNINHKKYKNAV